MSILHSTHETSTVKHSITTTFLGLAFAEELAFILRQISYPKSFVSHFQAFLAWKSEKDTLYWHTYQLFWHCILEVAYKAWCFHRTKRLKSTNFCRYKDLPYGVNDLKTCIFSPEIINNVKNEKRYDHLFQNFNEWKASDGYYYLIVIIIIIICCSLQHIQLS